MAYDSWGRVQQRDARAFGEKAYQRAALAAWDEKWHGLSVAARSCFLTAVKGPVKKQSASASQPSVAPDKFPPEVLRELIAAGFVARQPARSKALPERVFAAEDLYDFATRIRGLRRLHLLATDQPSELAKYVAYAFYGGEFAGVLNGVIQKAGIEDYAGVEDLLARYVVHQRWPGWVARALKAPLAERIVAVVRAAEGPVPLAELAGRIKGADPAEVRSVVDQLVTHLALVEDLHPRTLDLIVGLLPSVEDELRRAAEPRRRPPLVVCERPVEVGPEGSILVNDLRAVLLEVASEPPRLRQDQGLFQKEVERFRAVLDPLPAWLARALNASDDARLTLALSWARMLQLVKETTAGKQTRLHLAAQGNTWLGGGVEDQCAGILDRVRAFASRHDPDLAYWQPDFSGWDLFNVPGYGDTRFLGAQIIALQKVKGKGTRPTDHWDAKPADFQALRDALDRALSPLPPGVFHTLESVAAHLTFGPHNPVNLGVGPDQVLVYQGGRVVPPLEEHREEAGRLVIDALTRRRLVPLGCVRAAVDDQGRLCIARAPRLDAYFGRATAHKADPAGRAAAAAAATAARVVVQPDFSVIVIGLNPGPAAELAPFCERTTKGGGQGALVLKLTRESVVKAVSHGLKPAEIVARLERHASLEVPANVLTEVRAWSRWVRHVSTATMTVVRCPDRETADRVVSALKRQAQRVNDTLVAIDQAKLTAAERNKLRDHGIIVQKEVGDDLPASAARTKRRRY